MSETDDNSAGELVYDGAVIPYIFELMAETVAGVGNADTKDVVGAVNGPSPSSGWYYSFVFLIQLLVRSSSLLIVLQRKAVERVEVGEGAPRSTRSQLNLLTNSSYQVPASVHEI